MTSADAFSPVPPPLSVDELLARPSVRAPALSHDGTLLAAIAGDGEVPAAVTSPSLHWDPQPLDVGAPAITVAWSPTADRLAVGSPGGAVRVVQPAGGPALTVTGLPAPVWSRLDGRLLMSADGVLSALDAVTGAAQVLTDGAPGVLVDAAADRLLLRGGPRGRRHLRVTAPTGAPLRRVPPAGAQGSAELGRLTTSGAAVLVRTDADREWAALVEVEVASGVQRLLAEREGAELDRFAVDRDERTVVLVWTRADGSSEVSVLELASGQERPVTGLPHGVVAWLDAGRTAAVLEVSTTTSPPGLWLLDLAGAVCTPLTPYLPDVRLVEGEHVDFRATDGLALSGWLYRPRGAAAPGPAVVSLHGGPESQERPAWSPQLQALAAAGIAVLAPNVRGSTGSGRSFLERDAGLGRLAAVGDVAAAAGFLIDAGVADPRRLGVHGTSYGGFLALAAVTTHPAAFRAAASVSGLLDLPGFFAGTEPAIADAARTKYGDPRVDEALLRQLSPLPHLAGARVPTLLVHGDQDTNVPTQQSRDAHARLLAAGVETELVLLAGEGHTALRRSSRVRETAAVTEWFTRQL